MSTVPPIGADDRLRISLLARTGVAPLTVSVTRIGKGMVFAAWAALLALVAFLFQGELERQFNPNPDPRSDVAASGSREVVLHRNRAGHYVATGEVNGKTVEFLLDTGATDVALSRRTADRLGLRGGAPVALSTANGVVRGTRAVLESVSIGGITRQHVRAVITPGIADEIVLLGMSFLQHVELVQREGTLILRQ